MYITANGQPVLSSTHLNLLAKHLPLLVNQTVNYAAAQQANCITVRTGTCPSEAYLLVSNPSNVSGTLSWRARDLSTEEYVTISFQDFKVEHSEKVLPASLISEGVSLVKLVDQRYALADSLQGNRYNLVESYNAFTGAYTYVAETINGSSAWTWAELFSLCWSIPSAKSLNTTGVTFPAYTPQDLDFRFLTRKQALDILCMLTNTVIIPNADGTYILVNYTNGTANLNSILSAAAGYLIHDDWFSTSNPGYVPPSSLSLHFRKHQPTNGEVDLYHKLSRTPAATNRSGETIGLRLAAYKVEDEGNLTSAQRPSNIADAFKTALDLRLSHFPSQKKTYGDTLRILLASDLECVSYYDYGAGPQTRIESAQTPLWVPMPEDLSTSPDVDQTMLFCTVSSEVTGGANFTVSSGNYRVIYGEETRGSITVINTFAEHFSPGDKITVHKRDADDNYEPDRASAGQGSQVIHYELTENMTLSDTEALAKPVLANGTIDAIADAFYVVDQKQQFMGKAAFTDAIGAKTGYRGYAVRFSDSYLGGLPGYRIISQEGPMLILAVVLNENYQESPGTTTVAPLNADAQKQYGNPFRGRYPYADSGTGAFEVHDPYVIAKGSKQSDKWFVIYDEVNDRYNFFTPFYKQNYVRIRGKLKGSAVTRSSTTFIIDNVEAVIGKSPAASSATEITVQVPPNAKVDIPSDYTEWIYAQWNDKLGSSDVSHWDCGDAANHYLHMRGHVGFSTSEFRLLTVKGNTEADMKWLSIAAALKELTGYTHANIQSVLHDANTDPQWKDDGTCP